MSSARDGANGDSSSRDVQAWIQSNPTIARRLYRAIKDRYGDTWEYTALPDELQAQHRSLLLTAHEAGVIRPATHCYDRGPAIERHRWTLTDEFERAMADRDTDREGWCRDPDCARTAIHHGPDGPQCPCGAALREEVVE